MQHRQTERQMDLTRLWFSQVTVTKYERDKDDGDAMAVIWAADDGTQAGKGER